MSSSSSGKTHLQQLRDIGLTLPSSPFLSQVCENQVETKQSTENTMNSRNYCCSHESGTFKKSNGDEKRAALALLQNNAAEKGRVGGYVYFEQESPRHKVRVWAHISGGLAPRKEHAFHIHEFGDARQGCASMGGHYNPHGKQHGSYKVHGNERHAGDLINNLPAADDAGGVRIAFDDSLPTLFGNDAIYGCSIVIHAGKDDLGLGGTEESLKTGSAGERIACAPIVRCKIDSSLRF